MLPGEPKLASAIDDEREQQHNSAGASGGGTADGGSSGVVEDSAQEDTEEQEEEKNPSIANSQWKNADGNVLTKALVGDEVYLCADVQDIDDGTSAKIKIVEKDDDGNDDDVTTLTTTVSGGKIECKWKVVYMEDDDDSNSQQEKEEKGYTLPEYAFTVECGGATSEESGQLDVMGWIRIQYIDKKTGKLLSNKKYTVYLHDGSTINGTTDDEGFIELKDLKFGKYIICL